MIPGQPSRTGRTPPSAWLGRVAAWTASAALVGFHVWLLGVHASSGRLFEPAVALRWVLGLGLFGALVAFRAVGLPALLGRRAAVVWLLVSLLHWQAMSASAPSAIPADLGLPVEIVASASATLAAAAVGVLLVAALIALRRFAMPQVRARVVRTTVSRLTPSLAHLRILGCRPPPSLART